MAYTPNTWVKGDTITSAKMNHMEAGISHAEEYVDRIQGAIDELEAGSLSAVGAAAGTMPVADGEGTWEWKADPVAEEVLDLKSALDTTNESAMLGSIPYAANGEITGTSANGGLSVTQNGHLITVDGTSTATSGQGTTKVSICEPLLAWRDSTTPAAWSASKPIKFVANHTYKFDIKKISGTFGGMIRLVGNDANGTEIVRIELGADATDATANYAPTADVNANFRLQCQRAVEFVNATMQIDIYDITILNEVDGKQDTLTFDTAPTENSTNPVTSDGVYTALADKMNTTYDVTLDWANVFGDDSYPLGWQKGYYNASGATGSSDNYMRTYPQKHYTAAKGDEKLTFSVPSGKHAVIIEYDENGANGTRYGNYDSGDNEITIPVTEGYWYKFCIGNWDGDAVDDITSEFLATVTATVKRSVIDWQNEQDSRISVLEGGENSIPEYYKANGWLQGKLDAITLKQNTISKNQDAFWLISDYHHQYNAGNSLKLLKYLAKRTGINKVFFAGDAGGAAGTSASARYHRLQMSASAWEDMASCADYFFGVVGNHEWISAETVTEAGVMGAYLNRYKLSFAMDAVTGNYSVSNNANKIRYYFVQNTSAAYPTDATLNWLYNELLELPDGWSAAVIMHYGWIDPDYQEIEYDGVSFSYGHTSNKAVSQLLQCCKDHDSFERGGVTYDFSDKTGTNHIIGVFSGHTHHGILFPIDNQYNTLNVLEFTASTDCMHAASVDVDGAPWYWENGTVGGTKVVRETGTVTEQCFYAVQIDLDAKKIYITAIGGDHDYVDDYEA